MSSSLPPRPSLEWLRKTAKQRLAELRASDPKAKLADAQRDVAREYGFPSWRKLKAHVEALSAPTPPPSGADDVIKQFFRLIAAGGIDEVRAVLDAAPQMASVNGPHPFWGGRPQPLHVAIENGQREIFDLLLNRGADIDGKNDRYDHWSPLMVAMGPRHAAMREELLRRGAHVGLAEALMMGDDARVDELLDRDGLPSIVPNDGSWLAFARTRHAIDRLLAAGAEPEAKDHWGTSPIESLSALGERGHELVQHLIARGVKASAEEYVRLGDLAALQRIAEADPSALRRDSLMIAAADKGHHAIVEWLLQNGGNANARNARQSRQTALHNAAWNGDLPMVQMLLAAGADPNALDEQYKATPLGWAETAIDVTHNPKCEEVAAYLRGPATDP